MPFYRRVVYQLVKTAKNSKWHDRVVSYNKSAVLMRILRIFTKKIWKVSYFSHQGAKCLQNGKKSKCHTWVVSYIKSKRNFCINRPPVTKKHFVPLWYFMVWVQKPHLRVEKYILPPGGQNMQHFCKTFSDSWSSDQESRFDIWHDSIMTLQLSWPFWRHFARWWLK